MQPRPTRSPARLIAIAPVLLCASIGAVGALGAWLTRALDAARTPDPIGLIHPVPLASGWGLLALLLLIIAGGFWMAKRTPQD